MRSAAPQKRKLPATRLTETDVARIGIEIENAHLLKFVEKSFYPIPVCSEHLRPRC